MHILSLVKPDRFRKQGIFYLAIYSDAEAWYTSFSKLRILIFDEFKCQLTRHNFTFTRLKLTPNGIIDYETYV